MARMVRIASLIGLLLLFRAQAAMATQPETIRPGGWSDAFSPSKGQGLDGTVHAMLIHDGALYVGGDFLHGGGVVVNGVARWDGSRWRALGDGILPLPGRAHVRALLEYKGDLLAVGAIMPDGSTTDRQVARWNGESWSELEEPPLSILSAAVYQDKFVVGGMGQVLAYDGDGWESLGTTDGQDVSALCEYDGELYAAGPFTHIGNLECNEIAAWDGVQWTRPAIYMPPDCNSYAMKKTEYGLFLHACRGSIWNGSYLTSVPNIPSDGRITDIALMGFELLATAVLPADSASGQGRLFRYDSVAWIPVEPLLDDDAYALQPWGDQLWVGGAFEMAGDEESSHIGLWTDSKQTPAAVVDISTQIRQVQVWGERYDIATVFWKMSRASFGTRFRVELEHTSGVVAVIPLLPMSGSLYYDATWVIDLEHPDLAWLVQEDLNGHTRRIGPIVPGGDRDHGASPRAGSAGSARVGKSAWEAINVYFPDTNEFRMLTPALSDEPSQEAASHSALTGNSPNPFNPATRIDFSIPSEGPVRLEIFDARGRHVRTLLDETMKAGAHFAVWDGRDDKGISASSGSYFYRLTSGTQTSTQKMLLLK